MKLLLRVLAHSSLFHLVSLVMFAFALSIPAFAATRTWDGSTNTDWHTASNWSGDDVPDANDDAVIPGGLTNYPILSSSDQVNDLNIEDGGTLTITGGQLDVDDCEVEDGGTLTLNGGDISSENSGDYITVWGTLNITHADSELSVPDGDFTIASSNGVLNVTAGSIYVSADFDIENGAVATLENCTLECDDDIDIESGGELNLDNVTVDVADDIKFASNSTGTIVDTDMSTSNRMDIGQDSEVSFGGCTLDFDEALNIGTDATVSFDDCDVTFADDINIGEDSTVSFTDSDVVCDDLDMEAGTQVSFSGGSLDCDDDIEISSSATFTSEDTTINVDDDVRIGSGAEFDVEGPATAFVGDDITLGQNAEFIMTDVDFTMENDLVGDSGGTITQNGGTFNVGDDLLMEGAYNYSGDAEIVFYQEPTNSYTDSVNVSSTVSPFTLPSVTVNKHLGGVVNLGDDIVIDGDFDVKAGEFDTGNDYSIEVTGSISVDPSATLDLGGSTITLSGDDDATVDLNGLEIDNLVFSGTGKKCVVSELKVLQTLTVDQSANACVASGGKIDIESSSSSATDISGTLTLEAGSTLELEDGGTLNVSGTLETTGTSPDDPATAATIQAETSGSGGFTISMESGSSLEMDGAALSGGVIDVDAGASGVRITDTSFNDMPSGYGNSYVDMSGVTTDDIVIAGVEFNVGSNVSAADASAIATDSSTSDFDVRGYSGDIAGETFDNDPTNAIHWINSNFALSLSGSSSTTIDLFSDINEFLPSTGQTLNLSRHASTTVGSDTVYTKAYNQERTKTTFSDFAGTINVDGLIFRGTTSDAIVIDTSAVSSSGTINFYNCIFVDPSSSGANALFNSSASCTINLHFCTVDSTSASAGHSGTASSCIFARSLGSTAIFFDYDKNESGAYRDRNLRLRSASGLSNAAPDTTFDRDIDGKVRPNPTTVGAHHFDSDRGAYLAWTDVGSTTSTDKDDAISFAATQSYNPALLGTYVTGSDGTNCYLSFVPSSSVSVTLATSWTGVVAATASFVQTDVSTSYWVFVSYDSDGDGSFDKVRKILHDSSGTSLTQSGDLSILNASGTAVDFTTSSGWNGLLFFQTSQLTGASVTQLSIATQNNNGEVHDYYFNNDDASGDLYPNSNLSGSAGYAAESFITGTTTGLGSVNLNPNPYAVPILIGDQTGGVCILTRYADGTNGYSLAQLDRDGTQSILNTFSGPASGATYATAPLSLRNSYKNRAMAWTDVSKVSSILPNTWANQKTLDVGLSGYGSPIGVDMTGYFLGDYLYAPFYNESTSLGAIAAVEYEYSQDGDTTLELLDSSYSDSSLQHDAGGEGFNEGVAHVVGSPRKLYLLPGQDILLCGTDAGFLYGYEPGSGGTLLDGFPMEFPGGSISGISGVYLTDSTLQSSLGMSGAGVAVTVFTDIGQIYLVRVQ